MSQTSSTYDHIAVSDSELLTQISDTTRTKGSSRFSNSTSLSDSESFVSLVETDISISESVSDQELEESSHSTRYPEKLSAESEAALSQFVAAKFKILQAKKGPCKSAGAEESPTQGVRQYDLCSEEFCVGKMQHLKKNEEKDRGETAEKPSEIKKDDALVTCSALDKLKIEDMLHKMKKVNEREVHEPRKCPRCQRMLAELNKKRFIRRKTLLAQEPEFKERLEQHLYFKDPATLIAEIIMAESSNKGSPKTWRRDEK